MADNEVGKIREPVARLLDGFAEANEKRAEGLKILADAMQSMVTHSAFDAHEEAVLFELFYNSFSLSSGEKK